MDIKIHSLKFDADAKLIDFVETKVSKLNHFFDGVVNAEVTLKVDNDETAENKVAEIKLQIPGSELFAKKQAKSFEEATTLSIEAVKRQLKKAIEKNREA